MQTITVQRKKLLEKLTSNCDLHAKEFEAALMGYQKAALSEGHREMGKLERDPKHRMLFTEVPPQDHRGDYGRAIRMLEMSVDDNVQITHDDFARFVDDDWDWRAGWTMSNAKYLGRR
jgi:hypothetical protein